MSPEREEGESVNNHPSESLHRILGKNPVRSVSWIFLIVFALFSAWNINALFYEGNTRSRSILLDVLPGDSFRKVITKMYEEGITHYPETLVFWGEILGIDTNIRLDRNNLNATLK